MGADAPVSKYPKTKFLLNKTKGLKVEGKGWKGWKERERIRKLGTGKGRGSRRKASD